MAQRKPLKVKEVAKETARVNRWADQIDKDMGDAENDILSLRNGLTKVTSTVAALPPAATLIAANTIAPYPVLCSASEVGTTIDGVQRCLITVEYTAPTPLSTFAGIYAGIAGYKGGTAIVKEAEDNYTGAAGGTKQFSFVLDRTGENIFIYFIPKNQLGAAPANWGASPFVHIILNGVATAPNPPSGLTGTPQALTVNLQWNENTETNMQGYNVYRFTSNTPASAVKIGNTPWNGAGTPNFVDNTAVVNTVYYWWVTAVNKIGGESAKSVVFTNSPVGVGLDTQVLDGVTFYRTTLNEKTGGGRGFVALNVNNQLASLLVQQPVGAPGDFPGAVSPLKQHASNSTQIDVAAFSVMFGSNTVAFNSGSVNPGTYGTYYLYFDDPTYTGGAQTYHATQNTTTLVSNDGRIYIGKIITANAVVVTGGGGSGSGGGHGGGLCFSPNSKLFDLTPISRVKEGDRVWIERADGKHVERRVKKVLIHDYNGPMHVMGMDTYVTPSHHFRSGNKWVPAHTLYPDTIDYSGKVFNLEIDTDVEEERNYLLWNGAAAHNMMKMEAL